VAYDSLLRRSPNRASREYLEILYLAARVSESGVDDALRLLIEREQPISAKGVEEILDSGEEPKSIRDVEIKEVDFGAYDALMEVMEVGS